MLIKKKIDFTKLGQFDKINHDLIILSLIDISKKV
jgi:hypothetical protein